MSTRMSPVSPIQGGVMCFTFNECATITSQPPPPPLLGTTPGSPHPNHPCMVPQSHGLPSQNVHTSPYMYWPYGHFPSSQP